MLKLVTIGCGYFSQLHHQAWHRLPVDHVGVCDLDRNLAESFARRYSVATAYSDFTEMLDVEKPDLVDIILPPDQHLDCIKQAADRGVSIICQKPFTRNLKDAELAVSIAEQAGVTLIVHENFRFQPWHRKIKTILKSQVLGEVYQVRFNLRPGDGQGPNAYLDRQPYFQDMQQFLIKETGIHFIDVFRFLFGKPLGVYADLRKLNPAIVGEDAGYFTFDFPNGMRAMFDGNRLVDHAAVDRRLTMGEMSIESEKGTLELDGNGQLSIRQHGANHAAVIQYEFDNKSFGGDCVYLLQRHILLSLEAAQAPENTAREYLTNLVLQEAVYLADELKQHIDLTREPEEE